MKMVCSCSVFNCSQHSSTKLSQNLSKTIQKIFSEYNFSFNISFSTPKKGNQKSLLDFCEEHQRMVNIITSCQLCSNQVERFDFKDIKKYINWNSILKNNNILLTLQPGMFICLTCKSCITDNDFLSPVNLKCLQENVEKKNNERSLTFLHSRSHQGGVSAKRSECTRLERVRFTSPLVTSVKIFKRTECVKEIKNKEKTKNHEFKPNKRTNKMMNILKKEGRAFKLGIKNCDTSSPKHLNQNESDKEIDRIEYNEIVMNQASEHREELKTKPVNETFTTNNGCVNKELASSRVEDCIVEDNNEDIDQLPDVYEVRDGEPFILPVISDVYSQQGLLNVYESNICIDLVNDSESSDSDEEPSTLENSNISENVFSQQSVLNIDESNIIDLLEDSDDSDDGQSNNAISNKPNRNKNCGIINIEPVKSDHAKSQFTQKRSHCLKLKNKLHEYSTNDNTTELHKNEKLFVSKNIDVENVSCEKNEELSMLRNNSDVQDYSGEKVKELFMSQSNTEEPYILSSDDDDERMSMSVNPLEQFSPDNEPLYNMYNIDGTFSLNSNHASPLRFQRTLQKVPDFYNSSRSKLNMNHTKSTNKNVESETILFKNKRRNLSLLKNTRSSNNTYEKDEIWNKAIQAFIDQLNDLNNPNKKVLEDLVNRMDGNTVEILDYLMENLQKICNGELIVSENADPKEIKHLKKYLNKYTKSLKNDKCYSDKDVSAPLSSSSPLSMSTKLSSHEICQKMPAPKNIISTDFNLSDNHNSLDTTTLTTSMPKTTTTKSKGHFYPLFINKNYNVELISPSEPKPSVHRQLKPKLLSFMKNNVTTHPVRNNPTNPKYVLVKKPDYLPKQ